MLLSMQRQKIEPIDGWPSRTGNIEVNVELQGPTQVGLKPFSSDSFLVARKCLQAFCDPPGLVVGFGGAKPIGIGVASF